MTHASRVVRSCLSQREADVAGNLLEHVRQEVEAHANIISDEPAFV